MPGPSRFQRLEGDPRCSTDLLQLPSKREEIVKTSTLTALISVGLAQILAWSATADLSREDRKTIKAALKGTLYLRMDVPAKVGFTGFGLSFDPIVEVSPKGINTDASGFSLYGRGMSWNVRINDPVEVDEIEIEEDDGTIEIEIDTVEDDSDHSVFRFVQIYSFADFQAAMGRAFSRVPLQDEHPDWPPQIRRAIAARQLLTGMTKRQAYFVVGKPEQTRESTEDGKEIVVWTLRQNDVEVGVIRSGNNLPRSLRFEDGQLVRIQEGSLEEHLKLDDE